jgi:myo-inositol 2-dehydrogenase/D-chiro-inositol 1-dehydrogenase
VTTPPRIGFVGAGFIAGVHAGILASDPRVSVACVHDPDDRAAAAFALNYGAAVAPSLDDLLGAVDAVYICSPNAMHAGVAVLALSASLHVFSEKPMATSLEDARRVAAAVQSARGVYQVGFNRRFASVYRALKERLDSGALAPTSALLKMNRGDLQHPAWTGDPAISGGFLYETPIHILDLIRHLFGDPGEVIVRARATVYDQLDDFSMLFTFASGMSAVLAASAHATWLFPFERVELYGDHATAATEEMERVTFSTGVGRSAETLDFAQQRMEERWGYAEEDARFVTAILGEGQPAIDADEALLTTELVERCYEAARGAARSHGPGLSRT